MIEILLLKCKAEEPHLGGLKRSCKISSYIWKMSKRKQFITRKEEANILYCGLGRNRIQHCAWKAGVKKKNALGPKYEWGSTESKPVLDKDSDGVVNFAELQII